MRRNTETQLARIIFMSVLGILLTACGSITAASDPPQAASAVTAPTVTAPTSGILSDYLDNRSSPVEVLQSLYNAINSKQYARAYSYWEDNSERPLFEQFQQGYADTDTVQLTTGAVSSNAGAGQRYFAVPVTVRAQKTDGTTQTFVGCYQLHLANPNIQAEPPFRPLGIQSANIQQVANDADTTALMSQSCP